MKKSTPVKDKSHPSDGLQRRSAMALAVLGALSCLSPTLAIAADAMSVGTPSGLPDASQFFNTPQVSGAVLSPNGFKVALRSTGPHGRVMLTTIDLATMAPTIAYNSDNADVDHVVWANNQRLAFTLADYDTPQGKLDAGPGLFAVNTDGEGFKQLVERQGVWLRNGNDSRNLQPGNTYLLDASTLRADDDVLVVRPEAYDGKDFGYVKLLKLNTKNGRSTEIEGPMHSVGWWPDSQGELRVAMTRQGEKSALRWKDPVTGSWRVLSEFNSYTDDADMQVRHVGADGKLYVSARRGRDKQAMWLLDPATGTWSAEPLVQSPLFDVDANVIARDEKVLGLRFTIDAEVTQWLDTDMKALQQRIDKVLPRTVNRLSLPWQGTSPWVLIEAFADIQPSLYFLFNRETQKFTRLGAERPTVDAKKMASTELIRVKARDGLEIPAWLTVPAGSERKNLPLVVLVHGGPFVRAGSWRWHAEVQFLAARGYAVLQPEFRGTKGFGEAHYKAGWKQWGKAMQNDVADVTRWAIAQGIADPKRIAIAGASYGGYATLMGLVREPDLFACGVAWVGVTDLDMLHTVNWDDISPDFKKHGMPKMVGDRIVDAADLKANSPLTHASLIKQPILLAYGSADRRVPLIHGEAFRKAVQAHNSAVDWLVYEHEGHGWRAQKNQIDFWNRTARFLDKHLPPQK